MARNRFILLVVGVVVLKLRRWCPEMIFLIILAAVDDAFMVCEQIGGA
jgi:hypothetical protein